MIEGAGLNTDGGGNGGGGGGGDIRTNVASLGAAARESMDGVVTGDADRPGSGDDDDESAGAIGEDGRCLDAGDADECAECAACAVCAANGIGPSSAPGTGGAGGGLASTGPGTPLIGSAAGGAPESQEAYLAAALFGSPAPAAATLSGYNHGNGPATPSSVSGGAGGGAGGGGSLVMSLLDPRGNEEYIARQELLRLHAEVEELERRLGAARVRCARVEEERDNLTSSLRGNIHGLLSQVTDLEREAGELRQENARLSLVVQDLEDPQQFGGDHGEFGHGGDGGFAASAAAAASAAVTGAVAERSPSHSSHASSSPSVSSPSLSVDDSGVGGADDGLPRPAATATPRGNPAAPAFITPARLLDNVARATSGSPAGLGVSYVFGVWFFCLFVFFFLFTKNSCTNSSFIYLFLSPARTRAPLLGRCRPKWQSCARSTSDSAARLRPCVRLRAISARATQQTRSWRARAAA
jgi:hypothetical protein